MSLVAYAVEGNPLAPGEGAGFVLSHCFLCLRLGRCWRLVSPHPADVALQKSTRNNGFLAAVCLLGKLFGSFYVVSHITACVWFVSVSMSRPCYLLNENSSKLVDHSLPDLSFHDFRQLWSPEGSHSHLWEGATAAYQGALLDSLNLLTAIGSPMPTTSSERICLLALVPFGAFVMGFVLAQLVVVLTTIKMTEQRRNERMNLIQSAMVSLQLPVPLQMRILQYHQYMQVQHDQNAISALFTGLSSNLKTELKLVLFQGLVDNSQILRGATPAQITAIVAAFVEEVYSPGDLVIRKGDIGSEMFFIMKGRCEVLGEQFQIYCERKTGEYFGEICALIPGQSRTAWIRAKSFCVLAKLTHECVASIFSEDKRQEMLQRIKGMANVVKEFSSQTSIAIHAWAGTAGISKATLRSVLEAWAKETKNAKARLLQTSKSPSGSASSNSKRPPSVQRLLSPGSDLEELEVATPIPWIPLTPEPAVPAGSPALSKPRASKLPRRLSRQCSAPSGAIMADRTLSLEEVKEVLDTFKDELLAEIKQEVNNAAANHQIYHQDNFCQELIQTTVNATVHAISRKTPQFISS
eukprot:gnl/MRDRNA2_/MRDRNA2_19158_c0_seq1.p1 gnl/MRDRNA2_/MRDRNA2_19158_c0~~gnl/MRDRNA2_/MRDRNA2_19158_c0_seq1.p1  ORF type:complete len:580 (-),score=80.49 gnl/MRDRNA2_/MRDRNA2_19158_c0_seq1:174-1913(-)